MAVQLPLPRRALAEGACWPLGAEAAAAAAAADAAFLSPIARLNAVRALIMAVGLLGPELRARALAAGAFRCAVSALASAPLPPDPVAQQIEDEHDAPFALFALTLAGLFVSKPDLAGGGTASAAAAAAVRAIRGHLADPPVLAAACKFLTALAAALLTEPGLSALASEGAWLAVCEALGRHPSHEELQGNGCRLLAALCLSISTAADTGDLEASLEAAARALRIHGATSARSAVSAVSAASVALLGLGEKIREAAEAGGPPQPPPGIPGGLVESCAVSMRRFPGDVELQSQSICLLVAVACTDPWEFRRQAQSRLSIIDVALRVAEAAYAAAGDRDLRDKAVLLSKLVRGQVDPATVSRFGAQPPAAHVAAEEEEEEEEEADGAATGTAAAAAKKKKRKKKKKKGTGGAEAEASADGGAASSVPAAQCTESQGEQAAHRSAAGNEEESPAAAPEAAGTGGAAVTGSPGSPPGSVAACGGSQADLTPPSCAETGPAGGAAPSVDDAGRGGAFVGPHAPAGAAPENGAGGRAGDAPAESQPAPAEHCDRARPAAEEAARGTSPAATVDRSPEETQGEAQAPPVAAPPPPPEPEREPPLTTGGEGPLAPQAEVQSLAEALRRTELSEPPPAVPQASLEAQLPPWLQPLAAASSAAPSPAPLPPMQPAPQPPPWLMAASSQPPPPTDVWPPPDPAAAAAPSPPWPVASAPAPAPWLSVADLSPPRDEVSGGHEELAASGAENEPGVSAQAALPHRRGGFEDDGSCVVCLDAEPELVRAATSTKSRRKIRLSTCMHRGMWSNSHVGAPSPRRSSCRASTSAAADRAGRGTWPTRWPRPRRPPLGKRRRGSRGRCPVLCAAGKSRTLSICSPSRSGASWTAGEEEEGLPLADGLLVNDACCPSFLRAAAPPLTTVHHHHRRSSLRAAAEQQLARISSALVAAAEHAGICYNDPDRRNSECALSVVERVDTDPQRPTSPPLRPQPRATTCPDTSANRILTAVHDLSMIPRFVFTSALAEVVMEEYLFPSHRS